VAVVEGIHAEAERKLKTELPSRELPPGNVLVTQNVSMPPKASVICLQESRFGVDQVVQYPTPPPPFLSPQTPHIHTEGRVLPPTRIECGC